MEAVAVATQTPTDLAAMLVLSVLSVVLARKVRVRINADWSTPVNIYIVVILPSGEGKSPVFRKVKAPVEELERLLAQRTRAEERRRAIRRKRAEKRAKQAEDEVNDADEDELDAPLRDAEQARAEVDRLQPRVPPRLLAEDITQEALGTLLSDHGRIGILSDEAAFFEILAGRYTDGKPNIEVFLKGHDGGTLRVDRKTRASEYAENPAITLGVTAQPDVLRELTRVKGFRARGLLARIYFALPTSNVGYRESDPPTVPEHVRDAYGETIHRLGRMNEPQLDEDTYEGGDGRVELTDHELDLTEEARAKLHGFREAIEVRLRPGGDLRYITDWACKIQGDVVRIAGLLHMAEHLEAGLEEPIGAATMTEAIAVADYLIEHALAAFSEVGMDPRIADALDVLKWIEAEGVTEFSKRDAHAKLRGTFEKADELDPVLKRLEDHNYIARLPAEDRRGKRGRKPSPRFAVNPKIPARNAQNPQNSAPMVRAESSQPNETQETSGSDEAPPPSPSAGL